VFKSCHIDKELQPLFPQGDQLSFWLDSDIGIPVSKDHDGREMRRIESGGQSFFLKRSGNESLLRHLRMLCWFCRPQSNALREVKMLLTLQSAGFAVMEPVAWGEEWIGWFKVRGFLLVREVIGQEVAELFDCSSDRERLELMGQMGRLIGRLHAKGFFHPVRLKDLILTEKDLVLIDRETSKPWKSPFLKLCCLRSLSRSYCRICRDGHQIDDCEGITFLEGYRQGLASRLILEHSHLQEVLRKQIRQERKHSKS